MLLTHFSFYCTIKLHDDMWGPHVIWMVCAESSDHQISHFRAVLEGSRRPLRDGVVPGPNTPLV
jgi:hypothetical protein